MVFLSTRLQFVFSFILNSVIDQSFFIRNGFDSSEILLKFRFKISILSNKLKMWAISYWPVQRKIAIFILFFVFLILFSTSLVLMINNTIGSYMFISKPFRIFEAHAIHFIFYTNAFLFIAMRFKRVLNFFFLAWRGFLLTST